MRLFTPQACTPLLQRAAGSGQRQGAHDTRHGARRSPLRPLYPLSLPFLVACPPCALCPLAPLRVPSLPCAWYTTMCGAPAALALSLLALTHPFGQVSFLGLLPLPVHARCRACSPRSLLSLGCATLPLPLQAVAGEMHARYTAPPVAIYLLHLSLWAPLAPWPSGAPGPPCPPVCPLPFPPRHYARHCAGNLHSRCRQAPGLYRWRQTTCGVASATERGGCPPPPQPP